MATHGKHQAVERSRRIYQRLLVFYPKAHRDAYGQPMAQLFGDQCRDAWNRGRSWGLLRLWLRVLPDLVRTSLWEHIATLKGKRSMSEKIAEVGHVPIASWQIFKRVFAVVFLLVFVSTVVVTFMLPKTYEGRAVVMLQMNSSLTNRTNGGVIAPTANLNPYFVQNEFKFIQSEAVFSRVIEELELNRRWKRYASGHELQTSESLELLRKRMAVRSLTLGGIFEIKVFSEEPIEAADIANSIAYSYKVRRLEKYSPVTTGDNAAPGASVVFVELADPARKPAHPNKPANILVGALCGSLLALIAGAVTIGIRAAVRRIRRPNSATS